MKLHTSNSRARFKVRHFITKINTHFETILLTTVDKREIKNYKIQSSGISIGTRTQSWPGRGPWCNALLAYGTSIVLPIFHALCSFTSFSRFILDWVLLLHLIITVMSLMWKLYLYVCANKTLWYVKSNMHHNLAQKLCQVLGKLRQLGPWTPLDNFCPPYFLHISPILNRVTT